MSFVISTINATLEQLSAKQILRYMGMPRDAINDELSQLIKETEPKFLDTARCNACLTVVPVRVNESLVDFSAFSVSSKDLAKNLNGCEYAILFAATLGMASEQQRRRAAAVSASRALVLDAMGSAGIEQFCDSLCAQWAAHFSEFRLRPRFSPGYGDFSIETQATLLQVLDAYRKIGVCLSDGFLMIPQKSVTAVVGLSKLGCTKSVPRCEECGQICKFRL